MDWMGKSLWGFAGVLVAVILAFLTIASSFWQPFIVGAAVVVVLFFIVVANDSPPVKHQQPLSNPKVRDQTPILREKRKLPPIEAAETSNGIKSWRNAVVINKTYGKRRIANLKDGIIGYAKPTHIRRGVLLRKILKPLLSIMGFIGMKSYKTWRVNDLLLSPRQEDAQSKSFLRPFTSTGYAIEVIVSSEGVVSVKGYTSDYEPGSLLHYIDRRKKMPISLYHRRVTSNQNVVAIPVERIVSMNFETRGKMVLCVLMIK